MKKAVELKQNQNNYWAMDNLRSKIIEFEGKFDKQTEKKDLKHLQSILQLNLRFNMGFESVDTELQNTKKIVDKILTTNT